MTADPVRHPAVSLPPVHALLDAPEAIVLIGRFGRAAVVGTFRAILDACRDERRFGTSPTAILDEAADLLARRAASSQRLVFNMTGTVLHTNLGRAPLPREAAEAAAAALGGATNLEFDLE